MRDAVAAAAYPLDLPGTAEARRVAQGVVSQLDDYLLPRLSRIDAPLLVVVGGSTGAGKSTLVNSLAEAPVSPTSILRPTTRGPVLVCHPDDLGWFAGGHVLPHLTRTTEAAGDHGSLRVVPSRRLTAGLALLDAPDIDSVVQSNRALAEQLLAAADLWLFVTTAARYADAVPWDFLATAKVRGTAIALVLDRVPAGGSPTTSHRTSPRCCATTSWVRRRFLSSKSWRPRRTVSLPAAAVRPIGDWLTTLALSAAARAAVVRQTVDGAIAALNASTRGLADTAADQVRAATALASAVNAAYAAAVSAVEHGVRDGTLLRGEVLARWQELVGTGEFMRGLQARVQRLARPTRRRRDRPPANRRQAAACPRIRTGDIGPGRGERRRGAGRNGMAQPHGRSEAALC